MKNIIFTTVIFSCLCTHLVFAETVTLSTYYPAPFGVYDRLRLAPRPELTGTCQIGMLYTRDDNQLQYCKDRGLGVGEWGSVSGVWDRQGTDIYVLESDTINGFHIGVGDFTPEAMLELSGGGGGDDLLMLSSDEDLDGDIFVVKGDGKVGIGEKNPSAKLVIHGDTIGANPSLLVEDDNNDQVFLVQDDGKVGVGQTLSMNSEFEVNGSIDLEVFNRDSQVKFLDANSGNSFSIGLDETDGNLKINFGPNVGNVNHFTMTPDGAIILGREIEIDTNGDRGAVKVRYVPDLTKPGYYATYAP